MPHPPEPDDLSAAPDMNNTQRSHATRSASGDYEPGRYFQHPQALVEAGATIGKGTRIWAFAHVLAGAVIGEDCNLCDHTFVEGGVRLGNRVTIKCGVFLWDGITIEDDVFIGPGAALTNDYRPRSQRHLKTDLKTLLRKGCSLGANSTTLPNLTIGRWAMVGAGSVVTRDVPDYCLVVGSPARFRAWICRCGEKLASASGRFLDCACGRSYEQTAKNEVKEFAANGSHTNRPGNGVTMDFNGPIIQSNEHPSANGR
jgi:UDP-2-acetamido-3-amino-2,3-dideoxy-glucuronate N-acetyltransferase